LVSFIIIIIISLRYTKLLYHQEIMDNTDTTHI